MARPPSLRRWLLVVLIAGDALIVLALCSSVARYWGPAQLLDRHVECFDEFGMQHGFDDEGVGHFVEPTSTHLVDADTVEFGFRLGEGGTVERALLARGAPRTGTLRCTLHEVERTNESDWVPTEVVVVP